MHRSLNPVLLPCLLFLKALVPIRSCALPTALLKGRCQQQCYMQEIHCEGNACRKWFVGPRFFVEDRNDWHCFLQLAFRGSLLNAVHFFLTCKNWAQGSKFTLAWPGMVMLLLSLVVLQWKIPASFLQVYLEMMLAWPLSCTWASSNTCVSLPNGPGVQHPRLHSLFSVLPPSSSQHAGPEGFTLNCG